MIVRKTWRWPTNGKHESLWQEKVVKVGIFRKRKEIRKVHAKDKRGLYAYHTITVQDFYESEIEPFLKTVDVISVNEYCERWYEGNSTVITVFYDEEKKNKS